MKKFLCTVSYTMLEAGKLYELDEYGRAVLCGAHHVVDDSIGKFVDTFERGGVEWILNKGEQLVPYGWLIDVMTGNGCVDESEECSSEWSWKTQHTDGTNDYCIHAIRIISTGEEKAHQDQDNDHATDFTEADPIELNVTCPSEIIDQYFKSLKTLKDLTQIQCSDGNWNHDEYMHGMANGMLLALSLFEGGEPKYLDAPDVWLRDKGKADQKIGAGSGGKTLPINADIDYHPHMLGGKFGGGVE